MGRVEATRQVENALGRVGFVHVAGVDEVGRGCLAGPVVAAAVILHPDRPVRGLADSKLVPPAEREHLAEVIRGGALDWWLFRDAERFLGTGEQAIDEYQCTYDNSCNEHLPGGPANDCDEIE